MGEVKRRKRESTTALRARAAEVGKAESATKKGVGEGDGQEARDCHTRRLLEVAPGEEGRA